MFSADLDEAFKQLDMLDEDNHILLEMAKVGEINNTKVIYIRSDEDDPSPTHWRVLLYEWNRNNSSRKVSMNTPMPDYIALKSRVKLLYVKTPNNTDEAILKITLDKKQNLYILEISKRGKVLTKQFSPPEYLEDTIDLLKHKYSFSRIIK